MALFTLWDYLVVISVLIVSTGIGIYYAYGGGLQTKSAFLIADSKMASWPVVFSLMATSYSAISLLGYPQESYLFGLGFEMQCFGYIIATPLLGYLFLPVFYKMRLISVYEYLERRFGYTTRLLASIIFLLQNILILGIALYAPATTLVTVTEISNTTAIIVIGLVVTFYSTVGGMKAVLFTDVLQALLMFTSVFIVIISSVLKGHGIGEIWEAALKTDRVKWPSLSIDPTIRLTLWSALSGGISIFFIQFGSQAQVQRMMAVKTLSGAQRALWWSLPLNILFVTFALFGGLVIFNFYKDCDPVLGGRINDRAQLVPLFVIDTMEEYPGLPGLFVSGIFCGCLSTVSSILTALSAITVDDYIEQFYKRVLQKPLETDSSMFAKCIVCFFGILGVVLAMLYDDTSTGIIEAAQNTLGCSGGPIIALFTLGLFTVKSNEGGCLIGAIIGLSFGCWIGLSKTKPRPFILPLTDTGCEGYNATRVVEILPPKEMEYFYLNRISYLLLPMLSFLLTIITGYLCSIILEKLGLVNSDKIYLDAARKRINLEIFSPPVAAYLERKASLETVKASECERSLRSSEF